MARYKLVTPISDELWIDTESENGESFGVSDTKAYHDFEAWLAEGGIPDPADPLPVQYSGDERYIAQVLTQDAAPTELWRYTTSNKTGYDIVVRIIAVDKGNGAIKKMSIDATIARIGATPSLVGRTDQPAHATGGARGTESGIAGWKLDPSFEGYDLVLTVVGAAEREVDWHATIGMVRFAPEGIV